MTTNAKHTPGPWTLETVTTSVGVCHKIGKLGSSTKLNYACLYDDCYSERARDLQLLADARLIKLAPDLLAALEQLAAYANGRLGKNPYGIPQYKAALVAIGEARGMAIDGDKWMDANNEAYQAEEKERAR